MLSVDINKVRDNFMLNVCLKVPKGEILTVLGPSGCGKSTLLNLIAGVLTPDRGEIRLNNQTLYSSEGRINIPIFKRRIGYIQQKSYLFPHMTVMQNITYALRGKTDHSLVKKIIEMTGIEFPTDKYPGEISGGQSQRVALARALMIKPLALLFDEPFSALDNLRRLRLRETLLTIRQEMKVPMIFVTHDLEEAYALGDRIAVMNNGGFMQIDTRDNIFKHPANVIVAKFTGMSNIFSGKVIESDKTCSLVDIDGVILKIPLQRSVGSTVTLGIRPEDIELLKPGHDRNLEENSLLCSIEKIRIGTEKHKLLVKCVNNKLNLEMFVPNRIADKYDLSEGDNIEILINISSLRCFNGEKNCNNSGWRKKQQDEL